MNLKWTKYKIDGQSVCSQLTRSQYRYFCRFVEEGDSLKEAFEKAKAKKSRKEKLKEKIRQTLLVKPLWENPAYETKMSSLINFHKKQIDWYQEKYKKLTGKYMSFFLPIPLNAKPELEEIILATRCGALIMEIDEIERQRRNFNF
jgi:hypothetical protein